jgi:cysteine-rich repeat protein
VFAVGVIVIGGPGAPHALASTYGNGVVEAPELCDDGNLVNGDGCDAPGVPSLAAASASDNDETNVSLSPACDDGIDNDLDGFIDFPSDIGCFSPIDPDETDPMPIPACADFVDNDGDGLIDFPFDPGCSAPLDPDETDPPPAACSDGIDNDADGLIDFPADPGCSSASDNDETNAPAGDVFVPVPVSRLLDTRNVGGPVSVGTTRNLTVTGVAGVPATATAVALNVAAVSPVAAGHLRVFPAGEPLPTASVINFAAGKNTPNHVIVKVGAGGQISMYAGDTTQVIVDVNGYFTNTAAGSTYVPVVSRTRLTTITLPGAVAGNPAASSVDVVVAGAGGIGADALTVAVDIAAGNPVGTGHMRVFPAGASPIPTASTHNFVAGDSRMNLVLVNPGVGGAITVYNASGGAVTVTVDTVGYFHPGVGLAFKPITPIRPLDTRLGGASPLASGAFVDVQIRGFGGVVPNNTSVQAVVVNVAAVNPSATGSVDIGPSLITPTLPWFTHPANQNVANLAVVPIGADGKIRLVNHSTGTTHLIVDITGYLTT